MNLNTLHPWHGINIDLKEQSNSFSLNAIVEIIKNDTIKYEIDKKSGLLKIDRPQKYSNVCPSLYGFIPKTYCGDKVSFLAKSMSTSEIRRGDLDPLDILILSSYNITERNIILRARPIGGLLMIDKNEADDKIIAVLEGDEMYSEVYDIAQISDTLINKLKHYFLTYKSMPEENVIVSIDAVYGAEHARKVIHESINDYSELTKK